MGRRDSEKILRAYLEDILWHSEDVADTKGSYQSKTDLINQYYKANDKHKTKLVHFRVLYENILGNIDVMRNLKQELEKAKTKSEGLEQALKTCQESREFYKAKYILEAQNKQIENLSERCQQTREDLTNLRKTAENINTESRRMRRKFTSLRQKYAAAVRHSGRFKKLKRYSNTLNLNANSDEDWLEQNTQTDDDEPMKIKEENRELKETYQNFRKEQEELTLKNEKLEGQIISLSEKLENEIRERENLRREIEDCEEELTIWEKRCKDLTETCNRLKKERQDLKGGTDMNGTKKNNVTNTKVENHDIALKQPAIVNEIYELYSAFGCSQDQLIPTSKVKKEMIRIHGKNLQELVATNKKLSKIQINDDDSKHQQQEFKRKLNRVKEDIKTLEEDNDEERLGKINETKHKFEEALANALQDIRERLRKILDDSDRTELLSQKYQELMSIMTDENNRLERFSYNEEIDHEKKLNDEPISNADKFLDDDNTKEATKQDLIPEVTQNMQQLAEINAENELLQKSFEMFDGTETEEIRGDLKRKFLANIAKINAIKVDGDESVRTEKIEAIKRASKCVQELENGENR